MSDIQCSVCEASFRPEGIKNGKCVVCNEKYPEASCKADISKKNPVKARTLNENIVREIVYDMLAEANIKRVKCDCGDLFFKRSPAQKSCLKCSKEPEVK